MQRHSQSGFTLIEITIVLVVIGILVGGAIKGQDLIDSARVKSLAKDFQTISRSVYSYQDKFLALPGDFKQASTNLGADQNGDGNGKIDGNWNDTFSDDATSEALHVWQNLRLAGITAGSHDPEQSNYHPVNAVGGMIGIQSGTSSTTETPIKIRSEEGEDTAITGTLIICSTNIPGKLARQLDRKLDDGLSNAGSMLIGSADSPGTAMTAVSNLNDDEIYTACMGV